MLPAKMPPRRGRIGDGAVADADCNSAKWEERQRKADAAANGIGPLATMFKMTKMSIGKTCFQFYF